MMPRFCRCCGQSLVEDTLGHGYDVETGAHRPVTRVLRCPERPSGVMSSDHSEFMLLPTLLGRWRLRWQNADIEW